MRKFIVFLFIFSALVSINIKANSIVSKKSPSPKFSYLTASINYASNTAYFGRTYGLKTPLIGADLTYTTIKKIWFSVSAYSYYTDPSSEFDVAIGYDKKFNDKWKCGLSYSHFEFPSTSTVPNSVSSNAVAGYLRLNIKKLYSTVSSGYMFGTSNDFYVSFLNSLYFEFDSIGKSHNSISIEPKAGLTFGTKQFATTAEVKNITTKGKKGKGGKNNNVPGTTTITVVNNRFLPLYADLSLPITYTRNSFDFEIKPRLLFPLNVDLEENSGPAFIFNAAIYYNLSFQKKTK